MFKLTRKALAVAVCLALMAGLIPPQAALAAAPVKISLGVEGGSLGSAAGASITGGAPIVLSASASQASLVNSASPSTLFSAPAPEAPFTEAPALTTLSAAAAAGPTDEKTPAPKASSPSPATSPSWLTRVKSVFSKTPAGPASKPKSVDAASSEAQTSFDGASAKPAAPAVSASGPKGRLQKIGAGLRRWSASQKTTFEAKRSLAFDEFGGPKTEPMSRSQRLVYGLKWGLNMLGVSALFHALVAPVLSAIPWPLFLSQPSLRLFGRMELLVKLGPREIVTAIYRAPFSFLGLSVPMSAITEEITFRLLGFGLTFGLLALVKPVARRLSGLLDEIPDVAGISSFSKSALAFLGETATRFAFPIAATLSSVQFAVAHFPLWGIHPFVFLFNLAMGFILARTAYVTRSLSAPIISHLVFNLALLAPLAFGAALGSPLVAMIGTALSSVLGVLALWYNYRTHRKERAFSLANAGKNLAVALLLSAALAGSLMPSAEVKRSFQATQVKQTVIELDPHAHHSMPQKPAAVAPTPAVKAPAPKTEDASDMVARVKPTVVQVILPMANSMGSGAIITPTGRIITNAHVVGDVPKGQFAAVKMSDGNTVKALILDVNHDKDIAILQLPARSDGTPWPFSPFASEAPREGEIVYAMGHPRGLPFTVARGVLSGLGNRRNAYVQYLQTDAPINRGNSGGPLFNARGEILGINTLILSDSGGSEGIGLAIIAPSVVAALQQFDATGNIATAALGIIADLSSPQAPQTGGLVVEAVRPGSAAAAAGIAPGDIIVGLTQGETNVPIRGGERWGARELANALAQFKPGDAIFIQVGRDGQVQALAVTLQAKPTSFATADGHDFGLPGQ